MRSPDDEGTEGSEPRGDELDPRRDAAYAALFARVERAGAPSQLDALVRAELARLPLERALAMLERKPVPAVLSRLVAEDIASGAGGVAKRQLQALPRLSAPAEAAPVLGRPWAKLSARRGQLGLLAAAAVAAMAILPFAGRSLPFGAREAARSAKEMERSAPRFRLVVVNSAEALDPLARGFAEGLAGGRPLRSER